MLEKRFSQRSYFYHGSGQITTIKKTLTRLFFWQLRSAVIEFPSECENDDRQADLNILLPCEPVTRAVAPACLPDAPRDKIKKTLISTREGSRFALRISFICCLLWSREAALNLDAFLFTSLQNQLRYVQEHYQRAHSKQHRGIVVKRPWNIFQGISIAGCDALCFFFFFYDSLS